MPAKKGIHAQPCDWCGAGDDVPATAKVVYTNLDGVVLDYAYLCEECCRRGATWDGVAINSAD